MKRRRSYLKRYVSVLSALLLLASLSTSSWSFDVLEALNAARERDTQWLAAQAKFQQAQEKIPQARSQLLPNLGLSASAMHNQQAIHYPVVDQTSSGGYSTRDASVNLTIQLWHQSSWTSLTQAEQQVQQARLDLASAEADLARRLTQAYADVVAAKEALNLNQALEEAYSFQLGQAQARFARGSATIVDADEARAKYDQAAADTIEARNVIVTKRAALAQLIGTLDGEPIPLAPNYVPEALMPQSLGDWQTLAQQNNQDYLAKAKAVEVAESEISKQRDAYLPTVDLVGTYTKNSQGNAALNGQTGAITHQTEVGIKVSMPLYSGGSTNSAVRQAIAALTQAQDEQEQVYRQLQTAVMQAYLAVFNGDTAVRARLRAVQSAQTALQSARKGLEHGMKTQLDVLTAQQQVATAQRDFTKTQLDVWLSDIKLKSYSGRLDDSNWAQLNGALSPLKEN